ncbi:putative disease resistance protein RGA1 [Quercus lobata]|uniref:putative disease resistance protein RGA1 n=1 Tax=Quercus lobata TaxID=97700 RepID=UPI0012449FEF|nr:putative disease resistance protein RGA1 [Quercus lobata]XP_030964241.1 putative disease resistance protein RGA1 [Quercus lobata]
MKENCAPSFTKSTTSLIQEEFSQVHGVKEDIKDLESKLTSIQGVVEDAENKQVNDPHLKDWLKKLQEAAFDAEDALDTITTEAFLWKQRQKEDIIQPHLSKSKISYKHDAIHCVKKITETFNRIAKEMEGFHLDIKVNGREIESPNYTGYFVDKSNVVDREDDKERITHMLLLNEFDKEGEISVIPIIVIDDKEIFNMHDLIHELALSISSPNCCLINDNRSYSFSEQSHHVSLLGKDVEQPMLTIVENARKLRSLLFPSHYLKNFGQALDRAFHTMRYFRTLDLSSSMILELPSSIDELKLLRYLDLSRTEIKFLPNSICNLYNLETLKLLGCPWLFKLPKDLGNLVNLRHMELEDLFWFKFSVLPPKVGNLTRLQNWHAFRVGNKIGYRIEELKNMAYLSGTLHISQLENVVNVVEAKMNEKKYLRKLVFEWSDRVVNTHDDATEKIVLEGLQPHSNLKELQICQYRGNEFPAWMREGQLQNLVSITLNDCTNCKTLTLGEIPNLRVLCVKGMQELEKWPEDWSEVVTAWEPMCGSWFNLLELNVTSCPKLQTLPIDFAPQKLEISGCELLVALPQPHFAERLQHLALDACLDGTLVRAIANTSSLYSLVISGVSNLTSLPQWPQLPGLKALYIRDCKDLMSLSESKEASLSTLLSLTLLSIRNCPMLVKLTEELPATLECLSIGSCPFLQSLGPKEILKSLPSLKDLYIEDCPMLQSLPEDGLPSSLQHLQIQRCPLLTERCQMEEGGGGGPDRPKVMHIPDLEIDFPTASSTSA